MTSMLHLRCSPPIPRRGRHEQGAGLAGGNQAGPAGGANTRPGSSVSSMATERGFDVVSFRP